jgi:hypothetical protein
MHLVGAVPLRVVAAALATCQGGYQGIGIHSSPVEVSNHDQGGGASEVVGPGQQVVEPDGVRTGSRAIGRDNREAGGLDCAHPVFPAVGADFA